MPWILGVSARQLSVNTNIRVRHRIHRRFGKDFGKEWPLNRKRRTAKNIYVNRTWSNTFSRRTSHRHSKKPENIQEDTNTIEKGFEKTNHGLLEPNAAWKYIYYRNYLYELRYVYEFLALRLNAPQCILSRFRRWAIFHSLFDFLIGPIDQSMNIFTDVFTRWSRTYLSSKA